MIRPRLKALAGSEDGSIIVIGAASIFVLALLGMALFEVGTWFEGRRNLQVRTDAAALASGQAFNACFNIGAGAPYANEAAADTYIESWAREYGGVAPSSAGPLYNQRFEPPTPLMSFQSDTAPSSGSPQPAQNLGHECFVDGNPANTSASNWNLMEDVRTTQAGISAFASVLPRATVHGWARVQLQVIKALRPTMPLAIPDINPLHVAVTFVNNSGGAALNCPAAPVPPCTFPLTKGTSSGTITGWTGPATVPMPSAADVDVGMRVSIGAVNGNCANVTATNTYTCYDYSSKEGILAIRSYSSAAVTTTPILRAVTPTTCSGTPYFSNYQANVATGNCDNVGVAAVVNFPTGATNQKVTYAIVQGACPNKITGTMTQAGTTWASGLTSLPTANGIYNVCLAWSYGSGKSAQSGTFGNPAGSPVQEIFSGSDGSDPALPGGPIMIAGLTGGTTPYSFTTGSTASLNVSIGLTGGVHVNQKCFNGTSGKNYVCATDPPILLRTANTSGSLNYAIDCGVLPGHTGGNLYQMVRYGCANSYSINTADICPDQGPAPTPPDCAPVLTGDKTGQVRQALNDRMAVGNGCAPNNYPNTAVPGDARVVRLVDTDFSAYLGNQGGSSSSDVPVVTFATFYITGWDGASNSCAALNEPPPPNSDTKGNSSNLWGHFIAYETDGTPSGVKCVGNSVDPCVAALVR
jgi:hypothetical protein